MVARLRKPSPAVLRKGKENDEIGDEIICDIEVLPGESRWGKR